MHGTTTGYRKGCRCALCKTAHNDAQREGRLRRQRLLQGRKVRPPHGTRSTYVNYHCRCRRCCEAQAEHDAPRRPRVY